LEIKLINLLSPKIGTNVFRRRFMCLSSFLAQVIGIYLLLISFAMLFQQERFKKTIAELLASPPLLALTGSIGVVLGLLIVVSHNMWVSSWQVVVTLFGWILLLQGCMRIFYPHRFVHMVKQIDVKLGYTLFSWIWLLVGLYLIWMGFNY
jgi:hypothetical protein